MTDNNGSLVTVPKPGEIAEEGFGSRRMTSVAETNSSAMAARAKAAVEAMFIMAMNRPRNLDQVRVKLLQACQRPLFAEKGRYYRKVGREQNEDTSKYEDVYAEGLSIRFAEEAARVMGNLDIDSFTIYDDPRRKVVTFFAVDLETNTRWAKTVTLEKVVERRQLRKGQRALGTRTNSYGDTIYIVDATPDEITKREGAEASKAWRDQILRHVPSDIKEECLSQINEVLIDKAAKDPQGERKKVFDAFATIGVEPIHLQEYLGHEITSLSPAELVNLRGLFTGIKDGQTTWSTVMEEKRESYAAEAAEAARRAAAAETTPPAPAAQQQPPKGKQNLSTVAAAGKAKRENEQRQPGMGGNMPLPMNQPGPIEREPGSDDVGPEDLKPGK